ncbi:H-2 class I histocompatibility antigen, Q9 alpha chain-like isoform X3 [Hemicordylus capensis]|uniref:H-2 class I histocompatibility antigen, Q9 alpha chain-like isoform X3 n=2 Tax=Hemicordylus capensis TaxID=884348 RepID=UPI0023038DBD|nr:H-2 class I histocompatibility antigen, Q9 alpha chain-like isoform X3 [Hemicordylus capensis]
MGLLWWRLLLLGAVTVLLKDSSGSSSSHSLRYFSTAVSEPSQGLPEFRALGYVDDQLLVHYDSNTRRMVPRVPWMQKAEEEDPEHWDRETQFLQDNEQSFMKSLELLDYGDYYYSHSEGFYTWQLMYGCELSQDKHKGGYMKFGYDGRDFLTFDKENLTWTADDVEAAVIKRKWDEDLANSQNKKSYLEETCIESLQKYLDYGNKTLLRTEPPRVTVTCKTDCDKKLDGREKLLCRAHGFYPQRIDIKWRKDEEVQMQDTFRGTVSPNSDGTYYTWLGVKIHSKDRGRYWCGVEHDGLQVPLRMAWKGPQEEPAPTLLWFIVGTIVVVVVLLVSGIACCIVKFS